MERPKCERHPRSQSVKRYSPYFVIAGQQWAADGPQTGGADWGRVISPCARGHDDDDTVCENRGVRQGKELEPISSTSDLDNKLKTCCRRLVAFFPVLPVITPAGPSGVSRPPSRTTITVSLDDEVRPA